MWRLRCGVFVVLAACADDDPWVGTFSGTVTDGAGTRDVDVAIQRCNEPFYLAIDWPADSILDAIVGNDTNHAFANPLARTPWTGAFDFVGEQLAASVAIAPSNANQSFTGVRTSAVSPSHLCLVPID